MSFPHASKSQSIKIAARSSDLARLQAQAVGRAIELARPGAAIAYSFRASLGDANLQDPLWKMPEKGVFTEDFVADLLSGEADLVVHSWKDLPTGERPRTEIVATLPRADARDLLLMRADRVERARERGELVVLTSSPRRAYNLDLFLKEALPFRIARASFLDVRGNVPTRVRKLFSEDADALIVAKAALDRLLGTEEWGQAGGEYAGVRSELRERLAQCRWMALPLSANPGAAAQGALAVEVRKDREDLRELLRPIACPSTFAEVEAERRILASYGGGCHQKIGVSRLLRPYGAVTFLRGLTDAGEALNRAALEREAKTPPVRSREHLYPGTDAEARLFDREPLPEHAWKAEAAAADGLWIARESALPESYRPADRQLVWCAGVQSWKKLAARGIWVNGCADGLGESEAPKADAVAGRQIAWKRLTHDRAGDDGARIATYRLNGRFKAAPADFRGKTHFFWMSGTAFEEALRLDPSIARQGHHATGPGKTATAVAARLGVDPAGERGRFSICLGVEAWRAEALEG